MVKRRAADLSVGDAETARAEKLAAARLGASPADDTLRDLSLKAQGAMRGALQDAALRAVVIGLEQLGAYREGLEFWDVREKASRRGAIVACLQHGIPPTVVAEVGVSKARVSQIAHEEGMVLSRTSSSAVRQWRRRLYADTVDDPTAALRGLIVTATQAARSLAAIARALTRARAVRWVLMACAVDHGLGDRQIALLCGLTPQQVRRELTDGQARIRGDRNVCVDVLNGLEISASDPLIDLPNHMLRHLFNCVLVQPCESLPRVAVLNRVALVSAHPGFPELRFDVAHRFGSLTAGFRLAAELRQALFDTTNPQPDGQLRRAIAFSHAATVMLPGSESAEAGAASIRAAILNGEHAESPELETLLLAVAAAHGMPEDDSDLRPVFEAALGAGRLDGPAAFATLSNEPSDELAVALGMQLRLEAVRDSAWPLAFMARYLPGFAAPPFAAHHELMRAMVDAQELPPTVRACAGFLASGWPTATVHDRAVELDAITSGRRAELQEFTSTKIAVLAFRLLCDAEGNPPIVVREAKAVVDELAGPVKSQDKP